MYFKISFLFKVCCILCFASLQFVECKELRLTKPKIDILELNKKLDRFHVFTVATYAHPNLFKLLESCHKHKIDLEVVGMNLPYYGNATKFLYMKDYLKKFKDDELVMFIDAFDVIIIKDKKDIYLKFIEMNTPFLMGAELNCMPFPHLAESYPSTPTPHKYVNTGTFIGYVKNVRELIADLEPIDPFSCDQGITSVYYVNAPSNKKPFVLDHHCELFLPLYLVHEKDVLIQKRANTVFYKTTQTYPYIIHANGTSFPIWNRIYQELIQ